MELPLIPTRFCPTRETLAVLNGRRWVCSYSGGKDSTTLVTWIEWLRRIGMVRCDSPALVMSDTGVEYPFLRGVADRLMAALSASGWFCQVVEPLIHERLYNRIFGIGNMPIHPGARKMRWCTRATKIDPMKRHSRNVAEDVVQLSGVRWGESANRDSKLAASGCAAGGECGLPEPGKGVFGPLLTWKTCKVMEWLQGEAGVGDVIPDLLPLMRELAVIYGADRGQKDLFGQKDIAAMRFGCIGCPAITKEKISSSHLGRPEWVNIRRLYEVWRTLYLRENRCWRFKEDKGWYVGPLKLRVRQHFLPEILSIQQDARVVLLREEDVAFVRDCWSRKVYPRGWSEADEDVKPPEGWALAAQGAARADQPLLPLWDNGEASPCSRP